MNRDLWWISYLLCQVFLHTCIQLHHSSFILHCYLVDPLPFLVPICFMCLSFCNSLTRTYIRTYVPTFVHMCVHPYLAQFDIPPIRCLLFSVHLLGMASLVCSRATALWDIRTYMLYVIVYCTYSTFYIGMYLILYTPLVLYSMFVCVCMLIDFSRLCLCSCALWHSRTCMVVFVWAGWTWVSCCGRWCGVHCMVVRLVY